MSAPSPPDTSQASPSNQQTIPVPHPTSERLVERAVLAYALVFVAVLTLSPMDFVWPTVWRVAWWSDWKDLPSNILFFMPVGYLFVLARAPTQRHPVLA